MDKSSKEQEANEVPSYPNRDSGGQFSAVPSTSAPSAPSASMYPVMHEADMPPPTYHQTVYDQSETGKQTPACIPDADRTKYMGCKEKITSQRRGHHCRNCGEIFCGQNSPHIILLPEFNIDEGVRVCDKCFDVVCPKINNTASVTMDESPIRHIRSQLKDDFHDLVISTELRETIFCHVRQWIGTKLTNFSSTILDFLNTTIKEEFDFDEPFLDKLKELSLDMVEYVPHIDVRQGTKEGTDWISCTSDGKLIDTGRLQITFLKNFLGYPKPVDIKTFNFKEFGTIQFQNEEPLRIEETDMSNIEDKYGELEILVFKTKKVSMLSHFKNVNADSVKIGTCKISLLKAFNKNNIAQEWPIISEKATQKIGSINLSFSFKKQGSPTLKEKLAKLIVNKILSDIEYIQEHAAGHTIFQGIVDEVSNEISVPFKYDHISQTLKSSVKYAIEFSTPKKTRHTIPIDLYYNDKQIGDICLMLKQGTKTVPGCQIPIESFNKDIIEIQWKNGDTCSQEKIAVDSIPWKSGRTLPIHNNQFHLELRSVLTPSSNNQQFTATNMARTLLNVLYFDEVNKLEIEKKLLEWDGSLGRSANNIISALRPCCSSKEWSAMVAWTLLGLKLLFPKISNKIVLENLKILSTLVEDFKSSKEAYGHNLTSTFRVALQGYENDCLKTISDFNGIKCHETEYKEIEWMINSLGVINNYQYEGVTEKLKPYVSRRVADSTREINLLTDGNLTRITKLCETYDSRLRAIQNKFGNFALDILCPLIVENVVDNILPIIKEFISQCQSNGSINTKEVVKIIEDVYFASKRLLIYGMKSLMQETESKFFQTFHAWVLPWIDYIKSDHKSKILEAVKVQERHLNTDQTKNKDSLQATQVSSSLVNELEGANHVSCMFYGLIQIWKENFQYYIKKDVFNTKFLDMIHQLFMFYLDELEEVALSDKYLGPEEYAYVMMSIAHVKYQYLDETFVSETITSELQSLREQMKSEVFRRAKDLTNKFCKDQKPYFDMYIRGENTSKMKGNFYERKSRVNNLNGCIKGLLEFLRNKHDKYVEFNKERSFFSQRSTAQQSTGLFTYTKQKIFRTEEEVIQEYFEKLKDKRGKDKQVFVELLESTNNSIVYRNTEEVKESGVLLDICNELGFITAEPLELISKYLGFVCEAQLHQEENTGVMRYIAGMINRKIHLHLIRANVEPREDKDVCNFKIKVVLLPTRDTPNKYSIKKKTPIYKETTSVLFHLNKQHNDPRSYKFQFDLPVGRVAQDNRKFTQYIELNLYDISNTTLWKYYRGHILIPINDKIPVFKTIQDFEKQCQIDERKFVFTHPAECIQSSSPLLTLSYAVLKERTDEISKDYVSNYLKYQIKDCKTKTKYGA